MLVTGDWMSPKQLRWLAPTIPIRPLSPARLSRLGKTYGLRWVVVADRQGFRGTGHLLRYEGTRVHAWMTFDCRPGVLQYLANLITAT